MDANDLLAPAEKLHLMITLYEWVILASGEGSGEAGLRV